MNRNCVVIGGGLAGAAVAASMARRGWQVAVLDAAAEPAAGASGLPVGLLAPHYSADDNLLSRLSRCGVAMTTREARERLREGIDWSPTGSQQQRAGAEPLWHPDAAWIKPQALVRSWLADPGITWRGNCQAAQLVRDGQAWNVLGTDGNAIASAPLVVIAAAFGSSSLVAGRVPLHAVRGQVTWGIQPASGTIPRFPVNGNGHFIPFVPLEDGLAWATGSTYQRDDDDPAPRAMDDAANLERLQILLPEVAAELAPQFRRGEVRGWSGVRCASADRRPIVGEIGPGLWLSTAMGSRGLTFSALCAEIVAARVNGEALPLNAQLAATLDVARIVSRRP